MEKRPAIRITLTEQLGKKGCHRGHKPGDSFDFDTERGKLCPMAMHAAFPYIDILRYGGSIPGEPAGTARFACPDVDTLNVFKLEVVDAEKEARAQRVKDWYWDDFDIRELTEEYEFLGVHELSNEWLEEEKIARDNEKHGARYEQERRIFGAYHEGELAGFLIGQVRLAVQMKDILRDGTPYFELEELYVAREMRSRGIGSALMHHMEVMIGHEGVQYVMLSSAAKEPERQLRFYLDKAGMTLLTARMIKTIG